MHDLHIFLVVAFEFVERYVFTYNVVNRLQNFQQKIAYLKSAQNRKKEILPKE